LGYTGNTPEPSAPQLTVLGSRGTSINPPPRCAGQYQPRGQAMPLDLLMGGALVLLFGMLVNRITQLTKDDVIEDSQAYLAVHRRSSRHAAAQAGTRMSGATPPALHWPPNFPPQSSLT
jgi:hypothetical protein